MSSLAEAEERAWELMRSEGHRLGTVMVYFQDMPADDRHELATRLVLRETRMAQSAPVTPVRGWRTGDDYSRPCPR